eukprot:TRINITY_DN15892_c0_g1_i3.p2 TRINITY_DN15892_c0_g1~~TRINITY_DN15892_c0_g1_i3.p2  ORF type:complete len:163 (-),score=50.15 TRINITY_DN15892_c0_g1_i3:60-548(-)
MLLQHKADVNKADAHGTTALHISCDRGPVEVVTLLLQARASVNQKDNWAAPWALHKAAVAGHADVDVPRRLIRAKANPNKRDMRGYTACEAAAELGERHAGIVALLQAAMQETDGDSDDYSEAELAETPVDYICLLYTSDAADEEDSVDLGGRRIIRKKKNK